MAYTESCLNTTDESSVAGLQQKRLNARDFDVIRVIGRGAFGEVQLVSVFVVLSMCGAIYCIVYQDIFPDLFAFIYIYCILGRLM